MRWDENSNGDLLLSNSQGELQAASAQRVASEAATRIIVEQWMPPASSSALKPDEQSDRTRSSSDARNMVATVSDRKEPRTGIVILLDAIRARNKEDRDAFIKEFKDMREAAFKRGTLDAFDRTMLSALVRQGYSYGISTLRIGESRSDTVQLRERNSHRLLFEFDQRLGR